MPISRARRASVVHVGVCSPSSSRATTGCETPRRLARAACDRPWSARYFTTSSATSRANVVCCQPALKSSSSSSRASTSDDGTSLFLLNSPPQPHRGGCGPNPHCERNPVGQQAPLVPLQGLRIRCRSAHRALSTGIDHHADGVPGLERFPAPHSGVEMTGAPQVPLASPGHARWLGGLGHRAAEVRQPHLHENRLDMTEASLPLDSILVIGRDRKALPRTIRCPQRAGRPVDLPGTFLRTVLTGASQLQS